MNCTKRFILLCFTLTSCCAGAQTFWVETFSSACASLCVLPYSGVNGAWTWVSTGTNGTYANTWYVSQAEGGMARGQCGAAGPPASLHVGNVASSPGSLLCPNGDCGAAYDASGVTSVITNARATSPIVNCTGKTNITLQFNYIMNGELDSDYATVDYYNGSAWSVLANPPITALCGMQGKWTHYSVALPASANNNANVQIGFNWQNNANNTGTDPSFAVDSVTFSVPITVPPQAKFTCNDSTICAGDSVHFTDLSSGPPTSWNWTFTGGSPSSSATQNPVIYYGTVGTYTVKEVVSNINGSDSVTKINYIQVVAPPAAHVSGSFTICAGDSTTLSASGGTGYAWSNGKTTSNVTFSPATTTTYTLQVTNGYCTRDTVFTITVNTSPVLTITGKSPICSGKLDTLTTSGGGSYLWSNGSTTSRIIISPLKDTTYSVQVSNGACSKDTSFVITVTPSPKITLAGSTSICTGDSTTLVASGGGTYSWSTGSTATSITVKPAGDSVLSLTVTNGGCVSDTTFIVKVNSKPTPVMGAPFTICEGASVQLSASGGTTYMWQPPSSLNDSNIANPIANPATTTTYTVTVANGGCVATDSEKVTVKPVTPVSACCNATIQQGQSAPLSASPVISGYSYQWVPSAGVACDTCPNTTASPTVTTIYHLIVTDSNGCTETTDTVAITVKENCNTPYVPNAFSPNGDGQNDILYVYGNCIQHIDIMIFDRWGNKVFESIDVTKGWDGTYNGKPMNTGTYVYTLKATDFNNKTITQKGNIALIR